MFLVGNIFVMIVIEMVICSKQINFYRTDWINHQINNNGITHHCIDVLAENRNSVIHEIISYCLSDLPIQLNKTNNHSNQQFTFDQLRQKNISSKQLYEWSASIEVIERYQLFLNGYSNSSELFFNCTWPRFGPFCEYSLNFHVIEDLSLDRIIFQYYNKIYNPETLTCYVHLKCNLGSKSFCLDWTEICDGYINCLDGIDEQFCDQLENEICEENTFSCNNGRCILVTHVKDALYSMKCLSKTKTDHFEISLGNDIGEPTFKVENIQCAQRNIGIDGKLTSSCFLSRDMLMKRLIASEKPDSVNENCWFSFLCTLHQSCYIGFDSERICLNISSVNDSCEDFIRFPSNPVIFDHVFFLLEKQSIVENQLGFNIPPPAYICYNDQLCHGLNSNNSILVYDNSTCRRPEDFSVTFQPIQINQRDWYMDYVIPIYEQIRQCMITSPLNCNKKTNYQCLNSSKCLSIYELCNGKSDCPLNDDEQCDAINANYCISPILFQNGICNCPRTYENICDDEDTYENFIKKEISFTTICDGYTELIPINIDGQNYTDETECQYWKCDNIYTRCNGFRNCLNGDDEVNCKKLRTESCLSSYYLCVSLIFNTPICLDFNKTVDREIDCLGGIDENTLDLRNDHHSIEYQYYHCKVNQSDYCKLSVELCGVDNCLNQTTNMTLYTNRNEIFNIHLRNDQICNDSNEPIRTHIDEFYCESPTDVSKTLVVLFKLNGEYLILEEETDSNVVTLSSSIEEKRNLQEICHRGLSLSIRLNDEEEQEEESNVTQCLCPPSYYGNRCEYQNERVSLTIKFQFISDNGNKRYSILISLIDDTEERRIHSYKQINYIYEENCPMKYNIYLVYSNRPKLKDRNYSIHIDLYESESLSYRGSLFIPVKHLFLPVNRISAQVFVEDNDKSMKECLDKKCIHGQCFKYLNSKNDESYCKCESGWTGKYCDIQYNCRCSSNSICDGITFDNRSICICQKNFMGPHCLIQNDNCKYGENGSCFNRGECISINENVISSKKFVCICQNGFSGKRCEIIDKKLIISFSEDIELSQSILIHFLKLDLLHTPEIGSIYRNIQPNNRSISVYWSQLFHLVGVQLLNDAFYLINVENRFNRSSILSKEVNRFDYCPYFNELFNETIVNYHLIRRIKYYHLPCQNDSFQLKCFIDETYFCLCENNGNERRANCFKYNKTKRHSCFDSSPCENEGQCVQDRSICPRTSVCLCQKCFYGVRCQFSSNLLSLSLDGILAYHIQPNLNIKDQSTIVKVSIALTTFIFLCGVINGFS